MTQFYAIKPFMNIKKYWAFKLTFLIVPLMLLVIPTSRDVLLLRILPPLMREVPTWDLVRMHLGSSAFVPVNMTVEVQSCSNLMVTTPGHRTSTGKATLQAKESLGTDSKDSWAHALSVFRNQTLHAIEHNRFMPVITLAEKRDLLVMYKVLAQALTNANIKFFLVGGSLLGAYRHRGLVPWDDDLDIGISVLDWDGVRHTLGCIPGFQLAAAERTHWKFFRKLPEVEQGASASNSSQTRQLPNRATPSTPAPHRQAFSLSSWNASLIEQLGASSSSSSSPPPPPPSSSSSSSHNRSSHQTHAFGFPFIDIFFYAEDERYLWATTTYLLKSVLFRRSDVFPLTTANFEGLKVPVPYRMETVARHSFDIETCMSYSQSHRSRVGKWDLRLRCSELTYLYPMFNLDREA